VPKEVNELQELELGEISAVDRPANSTNGVPLARICFWKRDGSLNDFVCKAVFGLVDKDGKTYDGVTYPKSDFAYTPDDVPSHWKIRLTKTPGGAPDAGIVGAAIAALGKGFRGKKVIIPAEALAAVKAKVSAAWKKCHQSDQGVEMPEVLKGESTMTIQEIEKRQQEQDKLLATLKADNDALKLENETVVKMSKKERKLFSSMSTDKRKAFVAADDSKRKAMLEECAQQKKEKAAEDSMDDATKAEFAKAGPSRRMVMIADAETRMVAKAKKAKGSKDDEDPNDDDDKDNGKGGDDDDDDDELEEKRKATALALKMADSDDRIAKAEAELTAIRKQARLDHFTKRAETELPNTAGNPVEKGNTLMTLADALGGENSEAFKGIFKTMKDADQSVGKHFVEIGKTGGPISIEGAMQAKLSEISKRDNIDESHAMEKLLKEAPEIYLEYEKGTRERVRSY
jgi:hypothetical protein